jgi:hypothetical protein
MFLLSMIPKIMRIPGIQFTQALVISIPLESLICISNFFLFHLIHLKNSFDLFIKKEDEFITKKCEEKNLIRKRVEIH